MPSLVPSRLAVSEPIIPPTAPAPMTTPSTPGRTCSVRTANSMNSALNIRLKKLMTATPVSDARMSGESAMNRRPTVTPSEPSDEGGSAGLIAASCSAEPRNENASATTASGALSASTSRPPTDGPPMKENARLA